MPKYDLFSEINLSSLLRGKEEDLRKLIERMPEDEIYAGDSDEKIKQIVAGQVPNPINVDFDKVKIRVHDQENERSVVEYLIPVQGNSSLFAAGEWVVTTRVRDTVSIDNGMMVFSVSAKGKSSEEVNSEFLAFKGRFLESIAHQKAEIEKHESLLKQIAQEIKTARRKYFYERREFIKGLGYKEA